MHRLQNEHWQTGIVPEFGGGIVFGRVRYSGLWVDIIRPTPADQYAKPSSFLMLPWANRIRGGVLRYNNQQWQLKTTSDDGTARHGDVRKRPWQVMESSETHIKLHFASERFEDFNFPFVLTADLTYQLDGADFVWQVTLTNADAQAFPAGFGFHPYFQHRAANMPLLQAPCAKHFPLTDNFATGAPVPVPPELDFRSLRRVEKDMVLDDLLTERNADEPIRLVYADWGLEIQMTATPVFQHVILFTAPDGTLAVEPQSNANDGFNLLADGVEGSGVFVLQPGETISGEVRLRVTPQQD